MKKEDIEFLKQLQQGLKAGNHFHQAEPRYWMILDYRKVVRPRGYGPDCILSDNGQFMEESEFVDYIDEVYGLDEGDFIELENCYGLEDVIDYLNDENITKDFKREDIVSYEEERFISTFSGSFLTYEDALKHLEDNKHHYSNQAHPYALTAFRNPRYHKLLEIIKNLDLNEDVNEDEKITN